MFKSLWLFGAFSPINGDKFLLEMPQCNSENFQVFLDEFASQNQTEYKIVVLDNGAFHKAQKLNIPDNIGLIFLPPYSPELNPAEKNVGKHYKRQFTNKLLKTLDDVSDFITKHTKNITEDVVKSVCGFSYILEAIKWT